MSDTHKIPDSAKLFIGARIRFLGTEWAASLKGLSGTIIGVLYTEYTDKNYPSGESGWRVKLDHPIVRYGGEHRETAFLPFSKEHDVEQLEDALTTYLQLREEDP